MAVTIVEILLLLVVKTPGNNNRRLISQLQDKTAPWARQMIPDLTSDTWGKLRGVADCRAILPTIGKIRQEAPR